MGRSENFSALLLVALAVAGCAGEKDPRPPRAGPAVGPEVGTPVGEPTVGPPTDSDTSTGVGTTTTTTTATQTCQAAFGVPGYLDGLQTPGNGLVLFCHRGPGASWTLMNVPVSDCLPHVGHPVDLFPTTLCDS